MPPAPCNTPGASVASTFASQRGFVEPKVWWLVCFFVALTGQGFLKDAGLICWVIVTFDDLIVHVCVFNHVFET